MKNSIIQDINGLNIVFKENIFMYHHELLIIDDTNKINITCESLPLDDAIGIWLDDGSNKYLSTIVKWLNSIDESFKVFHNGQIKYEKVNGKTIKMSAQQSDAAEPVSDYCH